jgi:hypothetical protein
MAPRYGAYPIKDHMTHRMYDLKFPGCIVVVLLASCAYIKNVPGNAMAFEKGLSCNMSIAEVRSWANASAMDSFECTSPPQGVPSECDAAEGRAQYHLSFKKDGGLTSVRPGYVYDLTNLTYSDTVELCMSRGG